MRRMVAEAVGTAFLLAAVVGSGIMGERLAGGNVAIALLANTLATGAALVALILTFGPISGAHFNPAVTLADASQGGLAWRDVPGYVTAQIAGAFAGVAAAHGMFDLPLYMASQHARAGAAQLFSEFIATFGLLAVIWGCAVAFLGGAVCRRRLHYRRVLVHGVHLVCKPGRDAGAGGKRYLRRNPARRCAGVYRGAAGRCGGGHVAVPLAGAVLAQGRRCRGDVSLFGKRSYMSDKKRVLILCTGNSAEPDGRRVVAS